MICAYFCTMNPILSNHDPILSNHDPILPNHESKVHGEGNDQKINLGDYLDQFDRHIFEYKSTSLTI